MQIERIIVKKTEKLFGKVDLVGAKNAALPIMAASILIVGKIILNNVPCLTDIFNMKELLEKFGSKITFNTEKRIMEIDNSHLNSFKVDSCIMKKMRASILVMGPLLARFKQAEIAFPGGCVLGSRPIDFHLKAFNKMGVKIHRIDENLMAHAQDLKSAKIILEYPSVGATENIIMASILTKGTTVIVNAALEPEVLDLIQFLKYAGAKINIKLPAIIEIEGVESLKPLSYEIMFDRLEAGSFILACAVTGGEIHLPQARVEAMEVFLEKLVEMGHVVEVGLDGRGIIFKACNNPKSINFRTMPYPGFPTDLQAQMMAALCVSAGNSTIQETVYEGRLTHVRELQKMGAQIDINGDFVTVKGVEQLYAQHVIASDIRASCALIIAGLCAQGQTIITGAHHLYRGYENFIEKLKSLGALIEVIKE